jgi:hypothetical protein
MWQHVHFGWTALTKTFYDQSKSNSENIDPKYVFLSISLRIPKFPTFVRPSIFCGGDATLKEVIRFHHLARLERQKMWQGTRLTCLIIILLVIVVIMEHEYHLCTPMKSLGVIQKYVLKQGGGRGLAI